MKQPDTSRTRPEIHHASAFFSGRVQGVGFRYQTVQLAREFEVSGFVRNLDDGRVQLEAEGEESEVRGFIARVQDQLSGFIRKTELSEARRAPSYKGFTIGF